MSESRRFKKARCHNTILRATFLKTLDEKKPHQRHPILAIMSIMPCAMQLLQLSLIFMQ